MKEITHNVLPLSAQQILKDAFKEAQKYPIESIVRAKTIESAIRRLRREHPRAFKVFKDLCRGQ